MARNLYEGMTVHCVVCTKEVQPDRLRYGSITCSEACKRTRKNSLRARVDQRGCRYCGKPSTPAEREALSRFRAFERKRPDIVYPEKWEAWTAEGKDLKSFSQHIAEEREKTVPMDALWHKREKARRKKESEEHGDHEHEEDVDDIPA